MARLDRHQYLIHLGYDGSRFYGVPPQVHGATVASALRERLEQAAEQRPRALQFTARTDRGVWAEHNLATCWFLPPFDAERFAEALSQDRDDGLFDVRAESTGFHTHARNVGAGKWYRYRVRTDGTDDERAWNIDGVVNVTEMMRLASAFEGTHDFNAYRYKCSAPDPRKTLARVAVEPTQYGFDIHLEGDGFLRQMVRKIVSVLIAVGRNEYDADRAIHLLHTGAERGTPKAAPACGLTLMRIHRADIDSQTA